MTRRVVGVDVGGTTIKAAVVDPTTGGLLSSVATRPTPSPAHIGEVLEAVVQAIVAAEAMRPEARNEPEAIAVIGVALSADVLDGEHTTGVSPHRSWDGVPVRHRLEDELGRPVAILNDADAAAIGESRFGCARDQRGVTVVLTFGTWIGSGILVDGRLLPNSGLGQLPLRGRPAEDAIGGRAMASRGLSWDRWFDELSEFLGLIDQLLHPDVIVLGGGLLESAPRLVSRLSTFENVILAGLGNRAGLVGAASAAVDRPRRTPV